MTPWRVRACYDEAGHVVADYRYGFGIDWAAVYEDGSGMTKSDPRELGAPETTDYLFRQLIRLAAGLAAQQMYLEFVGREWESCEAEDNFCETTDSKMMECIVDMMAPGYGVLHRRAHEWARRMVVKDWHLVEKVAQELMREGFYEPVDATARIMKRKRFRSRRVFKMPQDQRWIHVALTMSDIRGHGEAPQR